MRQHRLLTIGIIVALIIFILAVWMFGWDWTGFNGGYSQITTTSTIHGTTTTIAKPTWKTFWDLLQLAIIPAVLTFGVWWLNLLQQQRDQRLEDQRAKSEREISLDNQREAALQGYIDNMSALLLEKDLQKPDELDKVQKIARVRTLTALPRLDKERKRSILQFLYEAGLINKDKPIVSLAEADLSGADLSWFYLRKANLSEAYLSGADLHMANLSEADLSGAVLSNTKLWKAKLSHANLNKTNLSGADLHNANLSSADLNEANLSGADLRNAKLRGANLNKDDDLSDVSLILVNLSGADLSGADFSGAKVTQEQLEQAKSLKGATMRDGSKYL